GRGNIYVNGGPGVIALVTPDCSVRQVADGIAFPNGMAVTPDKGMLIVAESHGRRLTAFDIARDGSSRTDESGPTSATVRLTASASMPRTLSGTRTFRTNAAFAFA